MIVLMLATLGLVFFLSFRINSMAYTTALTLFMVYAALLGVTLAPIFLVYTGTSITRVFFISAASFGALSLWGYTTQRDLSGMGSFMIMGLFGLIIASLVNIFLKSSGLDWAISVIGVGVFAGLTAWDTQRIKEMYDVSDDGTITGRKAVMGALSLYLDFINLFLMLLRLVGDRRLIGTAKRQRPGLSPGRLLLCFDAPMPSPSIRPVASADIPAITRIYAQAVKHGTASFELDPPDEAEMTRRMKALLDGNFPYLVAEVDGALAGYAYAGPYRARPAYRYSIEDSIYIDPKVQRRGVGRALLERLIKDCERRGFRQIIAVIGDSAQTAFDRAAPRAGISHDRHVRELSATNSTAGSTASSCSARSVPAQRPGRNPPIRPRPGSVPCRGRAARGRAHGRAARSARSPKRRCRRPGAATASDFSRCGRSGLRTSAGTRKTRRGP